MLTASNRRVLLSEDRFAGDTIHIAYGIDTNGLKAGNEETAEIMILSNLGEYRIRIQFAVQRGQVKSSLGELHNLEDFAALAKADYREAFRICLRVKNSWISLERINRHISGYTKVWRIIR